MFNLRPTLAIDIGTSGIKAIEFSRFGSGGLRAIGFEPLPSGVVERGAIRDEVGLLRGLRQIFTKLGISPRDRSIAVSLSGRAVLIRRLLVPFDVIDQLPTQLHYLVEQNFQIDPGALNFSHIVLRDTPDTKGNIPILVVGARREAVEQIMSIFRGIGASVTIVDADAVCLANVFEWMWDQFPTTSVVLNVGADSTQLLVVSNGEFLASQEIFLGGNALTSRIAESFNLPWYEAEQLKINVSLGQVAMPAELVGHFQEWLTSFIGECERVLTRYWKTAIHAEGTKKLSSIFVCGGGARLSGLTESLGQSFGVSVEVLNPLRQVEANSSKFAVDYLFEQGHLYAVASGLALRQGT